MKYSTLVQIGVMLILVGITFLFSGVAVFQHSNAAETAAANAAVRLAVGFGLPLMGAMIITSPITSKINKYLP